MAPLRWNEPIWNRTLAVILWAIGVAGIINELFIVDSPRPAAAPFIIAAIFFPPAQAWDKWRQFKNEDSK